MPSLNKHWTSAKTKDYIAGINLNNSEIKFNPKNPTKFTIKSSAAIDDLHEWAHVKGTRGSVSTGDVVKNFDNYFQDAYPASDDDDLKSAKQKVIGSMPSGFGDGSFLFKHRSIGYKKNQLVCFDGFNELDLKVEDSMDKVHLNINGSEKVADFIFKKLAKHYQ